MSNPLKVITRFAPSPTGYLHMGGARTALYNWLYAKKNKGKFILRIEDTDQERSTKESVEAIFEALRWLGLDWDEGPYYQSQRLPLYREKIAFLEKSGFIYPAFETKEELDSMRQKAICEKKNPIYDRSALKLSCDEVQERLHKGHHHVWRFKVPDEGYTHVPELLVGDNTKLKNTDIGDFVITRPGTRNCPGMPLYNFVCSVDDADMGITHIIRGNEHFTNAARQVLLYQAMGCTMPSFVHLPIIMKNGKKMSKRHDNHNGGAQDPFPVSVMERAHLGYFPHATLNHLVLLGWSHPESKEIMDKEEMIRHFCLERLNKANPQFDEKKYYHFNAESITSLSNTALLEAVTPYFQKQGFDLLQYNTASLCKMIALEKTRCRTLSEFAPALSYFFSPPVCYEDKGLQQSFFSKDIDALSFLQSAQSALQSITLPSPQQQLDQPCIDAALSQTVHNLGTTYRSFGPVIRLALTGRTKSPGLSEMIDVMGIEKACQRLALAQTFIKNAQQ